MKTVKSLGEFGLIRRIAKQFKNSDRVILGIGDDAALVKNFSGESLLTTDLLVEGVDFDFKTAKPEAVGRKALAVNLSDIAAMGGTPEFALIGLGIPKTTKLLQIEKFLSGISRIAAQYQVDVVGGDLSRAPCWMISVALVGMPGERTIRRSGAAVGDSIYVTGTLGGSIRGKHLSFTPRVQEGKWLAGFGVTAMIDISDGFIQDLGHILESSKKGAAIELTDIPISKKSALQHALTDGEDFELLFTVAKSKSRALETAWKRKFQAKLSCVGKIISDSNKIIFLRKGKRVKLNVKKKGYQHFT